MSNSDTPEDPWRVVLAHCKNCGKEWVAVCRAVDVDALQCNRCGKRRVRWIDPPAEWCKP